MAGKMESPRAAFVSPPAQPSLSPLVPGVFEAMARVFFEYGRQVERGTSGIALALPSLQLPLTIGFASDSAARRMVAARLLSLQEDEFFPSDLAEELNLPLEQVERVLEELARQGAVKSG